MSASKAQILAASACFASLSCLASLLVQLFFDDQESALSVGTYFVTWVSLG